MEKMTTKTHQKMTTKTHQKMGPKNGVKSATKNTLKMGLKMLLLLSTLGLAGLPSKVAATTYEKTGKGEEVLQDDGLAYAAAAYIIACVIYTFYEYVKLAGKLKAQRRINSQQDARIDQLEADCLLKITRINRLEAECLGKDNTIGEYNAIVDRLNDEASDRNNRIDQLNGRLRQLRRVLALQNRR